MLSFKWRKFTETPSDFLESLIESSLNACLIGKQKGQDLNIEKFHSEQRMIKFGSLTSFFFFPFPAKLNVFFFLDASQVNIFPGHVDADFAFRHLQKTRDTEDYGLGKDPKAMLEQDYVSKPIGAHDKDSLSPQRCDLPQKNIWAQLCHLQAVTRGTAATT